MTACHLSGYIVKFFSEINSRIISMLREEQLRLLKGLISHLDNKTNINAGGILKTPADTYISEERFEMEWSDFFLNHPQILGLSGDLPKPGTYVTTEDFGVPIIAVRVLLAAFSVSDITSPFLMDLNNLLCST